MMCKLPIGIHSENQGLGLDGIRFEGRLTSHYYS